MNYTLHKLQEGFIITSDEIPKNEEVYWCKHKGKGIDVGFGQPEQLLVLNIMSEGRNLCPDCKKLIAQQDQIDFSALSEEEQKEIGYFDVDSVVDSILDKEYHNVDLCYSDFKIYEQGYRSAFQKAQELLYDRRFTLEDMKNLMHNSIIFKEENQHLSLGEYAIKNKEWFDKYIQSLSKPKSWKVELEMEYDLESIDSSKKVMRPKPTNGKIKILKLL
jgi:hypothetical protein